jgi:hypothetical protein
MRRMKGRRISPVNPRCSTGKFVCLPSKMRKLSLGGVGLWSEFGAKRESGVIWSVSRLAKTQQRKLSEKRPWTAGSTKVAKRRRVPTCPSTANLTSHLYTWLALRFCLSRVQTYSLNRHFNWKTALIALCQRESLIARLSSTPNYWSLRRTSSSLMFGHF